MHRYESGYSHTFIALLEDAIDAWPENHFARVLHASYLALEHRTSEALASTQVVIDDLESLQKASPDRFRPWQDLYAEAVLNASLYMLTLDNHADAWLMIAKFDEEAARARRTVVSELHLVVHDWIRTRILVAAGDPEQASAALETLHPLNCGRSAREKEDCPSQMIRRFGSVYPRYLDRGAFEAMRQYTFGLLAVREKDLRQAKDRFQKAMELDRSLLEAELGFGIVLFLCATEASGCGEDPDLLFERSVAVLEGVGLKAERGLLYRPQNVHFNLGNVFLTRAEIDVYSGGAVPDEDVGQSLESAEESYCRAAARELDTAADPRCAAALCSSESYGLRSGKPSQLLVDTFNNLGLVSEKWAEMREGANGGYAVAADCFERAVAGVDVERDERALSNLTRVLRRLGREEQFLLAADLALRADPLNADVLGELGEFFEDATPIFKVEALTIFFHHLAATRLGSEALQSWVGDGVPHLQRFSGPLVQRPRAKLAILEGDYAMARLIYEGADEGEVWPLVDLVDLELHYSDAVELAGLERILEHALHICEDSGPARCGRRLHLEARRLRLIIRRARGDLQGSRVDAERIEALNPYRALSLP